jgi:hypothetical protein
VLAASFLRFNRKLSGHLGCCCVPALLQVQPQNLAFSRGIRQRLAKAAKEGGWLEKYKIICGE